MDLLSKMVVGQPHFVRCIKPNDDRQALRLCQERVLVQLRYTGVLETVNIRRQGYSHRIPLEEFVNRYYYLAFRAHQPPEPGKENVIAILERAKLENWVMGKTKVFLRYYHVEQLNLLLREVIARVVVIQAFTKGWLGAQRYRKAKGRRNRSAIIIQSAWRGHVVRQHHRQLKRERDEAAVRIQSGMTIHRHKLYESAHNVHKVSFHFFLFLISTSGVGAALCCLCHHQHVPLRVVVCLDDCPVFSVAGPGMKPQHRTPRRRGQQPKLLNSPEDSLYYNQLNVSSKRQIKVLDGEDEYYKLLSTVESIPRKSTEACPPPSHSSGPLDKHVSR
uniref:non-specific serine/threonine protein kinase n=1 Tax=Neogobius melanostomus TaxID=47308 RepID=A0A8C6UWJ9_9GOBI